MESRRLHSRRTAAAQPMRICLCRNEKIYITLFMETSSQIMSFGVQLHADLSDEQGSKNNNTLVYYRNNAWL